VPLRSVPCKANTLPAAPKLINFLQDEDPVKLLLAATEDHVPVNRSDGSPSATPLAERQAELDFFMRNPDNRPSVDSIINELIEGEDYQDQIVDGGRRTMDARQAKYGKLDKPLSQQIMDALYETKKITQLFSHQAESINHLAAGNSVIVSTSTSSGKSLIYQIPALQAFEQDPEATAIYIYPTKALAQDQKRGLSELLACCDHLDSIKIATFDGDTPKQDRDYIRENANVIFTNPDMLHITLLPNEDKWRRMFRNLKLVVVDGKSCLVLHLIDWHAESVTPIQSCICTMGSSDLTLQWL
jgi:DEAD/DEAH box helicase domain-containing protein